MKAQNLNASSVKTKQLIRDTFAELLHEKRSIEKISVAELAKRAGLNRSTFYAHYAGIWQVADDLKAETVRVFFENQTTDSLENVERFFDEIYQYLKKNDDFFRLIFISDEVTSFVRSLGEIGKDRIYSTLSNDSRIVDHQMLELEISTFCDGLAMQIIRYYNGNLMNITLENIIEFGKQWCQNMVVRRKNVPK